MSSDREKKPVEIVWPSVWGKSHPPGEPPPTASAFLNDVRSALNLADLTKKTQSFLIAQDVAMGSYHHIMPFAADDVFTVSIPGSQFGYPADYAAHYVHNRYWEHDPAVRLARKRALPFLWTDIALQDDLTDKEKEVLNFAIKARLGNGVCIPLFGPNGRNGYATLGTFPIGETWPAEKVAWLGWATQVAHLRVCELIAELMPQRHDLSARELEILNWIARGKSNSVIAEIVGISSNTVDTYLRRIFEKLGVTDRTSAAIKGLVLGLLK